MNENEKEIARINGEARKRGLSYGQYVARARLLPEDGDLSTALRSKGEAKDAAGQGGGEEAEEMKRAWGGAAPRSRALIPAPAGRGGNESDTWTGDAHGRTAGAL